MEAEARYTYVGLAVLALIAALVGSVVWLKNVGAQRDFQRYTILFEQQPLDGLAVGADVNLRGIKVGRVESYGLAGANAERVRVEVRVDRRTPVTTQTVALVNRNLLTGIAHIALVPRGSGGEPLTAVPPGESYPVIAEGLSERELIAGRVTELGEQVAHVLHGLETLLAPANQALIVDTLRGARELTTGLAARVEALDRTLDRAGEAAGATAAAAARLAAAGDRVAAVAARAGDDVHAIAARTGDPLPRTLAAPAATLRQTRETLARLAQAVEAVQAQSTATAQRLEGTAIAVEDQLGAALAELRLGVDVAARTLDRLREPRAALLGPGRAALGPGEAVR